LQRHGEFFTAYTAEKNIQETLVQLYTNFTQRITKKSGWIHQAILGKEVDYAGFTVISTPKVRTAETPDDQLVPLGHIGVPLYMLASLFTPFVVYNMQAMLQELGIYKFTIGAKGAEPILDKTVDKLNSNHYEKLIKLFGRSPEHRDVPIGSVSVDGHDAFTAWEKILGRTYTLTDFMFNAVSRSVKDKFVLATRYPIEHYLSIEGFRPVILTTENTKRLELPGGNIEKFYPDLEHTPVRWIESTMVNTAYLEGFNGDFDGDTMALEGVFTQEANLQLAEIAKKPLSLLSASGTAVRTSIKEGKLSLYSLTM
jgi:DNA-directed RNA polymerase beta' subunit